MIIPSIDLRAGSAVQLIGGKEQAIDAGDPFPIAERFKLAGEIAVVDLDAAFGTGHNRPVIEQLLTKAPCRVGGGIRSYEQAVQWLDAGATSIVLGTAATPKLLQRLPRSRVIAALDAVNGEVVIDGWQTKTGCNVLECIEQLRKYVKGFLITFVEREGRMGGIDLDAIRPLINAAGECSVTIAGGVTTPDDVRQLDDLGADAQVGMSLYTGKLNLADAIAAPLRSDRPDGLWPTVVVDERNTALGLAYSSSQSLREAVQRQQGVYQSRTRGLWIKGETSGATQRLLRITPDCDRDCLRFTVRQLGRGFCHRQTATCWSEETGLTALERTLAKRVQDAPVGSYVHRLLADPELLRAKLLEEAGELADATELADAIHESADLLFFAMTAMQRKGVTLAAVEQALDRRAQRVTRRPGDAKPVTSCQPEPSP